MDDLKIQMALQISYFVTLLFLLVFNRTRLLAYILLVASLLLRLNFMGAYTLAIIAVIVSIMAEILSFQIDQTKPIFMSLRKRKYYYLIPILIIVLSVTAFFSNRELFQNVGDFYKITLGKQNWTLGLLLIAVLYFVKNLSWKVK